MIRPFVLAALCAASMTFVAGAQAKPPKAQPDQQQAAAETLSPTQLEIATRVMTGNAKCEFDQHVSVLPVEGKPGHFHVAYKNATYTMVPQETSTGAVRLEDRHAGVMWLQIPSKSMLMNTKAGQRMVDSCTQTQQRASL
jgi:hypothetical protein